MTEITEHFCHVTPLWARRATRARSCHSTLYWHTFKLNYQAFDHRLYQPILPPFPPNYYRLRPKSMCAHREPSTLPTWEILSGKYTLRLHPVHLSSNTFERFAAIFSVELCQSF